MIYYSFCGMRSETDKDIYGSFCGMLSTADNDIYCRDDGVGVVVIPCSLCRMLSSGEKNGKK